MNTYVLVRHKINDFEKWKPIYDEHEVVRKTYGIKELQLLRSKDNKNDLTLLFEVNDVKNAKAFLDSDDLRETMKKAGVVTKPEVFFFEG